MQPHIATMIPKINPPLLIQVATYFIIRPKTTMASIKAIGEYTNENKINCLFFLSEIFFHI